MSEPSKRKTPTPRQIEFLRKLDFLLEMIEGRVSCARVCDMMMIATQTGRWYRDVLERMGYISRSGIGSGSSLSITDKGREYLRGLV